MCIRDRQGTLLLGEITLILFAKEVINTFIVFGQRYYGEKIRIQVSSELSQTAVDRILSYGLGFYSDNTVSYTHLDVYKRQQHYRSIPQNQRTDRLRDRGYLQELLRRIYSGNQSRRRYHSVPDVILKGVNG